MKRELFKSPRIGLTLLAAGALAGASMPAWAAEQFIPMLSYRVGPYAPGGSGFFGGYIDYLDMINKRDGGVNGVKLTWEECERPSTRTTGAWSATSG